MTSGQTEHLTFKICTLIYVVLVLIIVGFTGGYFQMAQFGSIKLAARIKFEFTSFEMSTEPEELIRELRDLSLAMQKKQLMNLNILLMKLSAGRFQL